MPKREPLMPNMDSAKAEEALNIRQEADYQCYMVLRDLVKWIQPTQYRDKEERAIVEELLERAQKVVDDREQANDQFLRAVVGNRTLGSKP